VRSVFVIGSDKKVKLTITSPASTGRNFEEILRCSTRSGSRRAIRSATPVNWHERTRHHRDIRKREDAKEKFPKGFRAVKPYFALHAPAQALSRDRGPRRAVRVRATGPVAPGRRHRPGTLWVIGRVHGQVVRWRIVAWPSRCSSRMRSSISSRRSSRWERSPWRERTTTAVGRDVARAPISFAAVAICWG